MSSDCDVVVQASEDILVSADCAQAGAEISVTVVSGGVGPAGARGYGLAVTVGRSNADHVATGTLGSPTDHTTLQAAIAAVQAAGGGTVFVKAGVYFLGATVNITAPNVQIIGEGRGTELRAVGNYGTVLNCALTTPPTSWPGLSGLVIESIRFESTVERTSGAAIYAQRTHNAVIRDVYLADLTYGVAYGITTPVPPAFWIGIHLDGQDQCLIDNVVGCAISIGIKVNGWDSASADFAYDGMISNCKLWGSPGTKRGIAISVGPNCGGTVLDFNSLNQWAYSLYAVHTSGQGGGILAIRGGYAENDAHGYHIVGFQNVVVSDLWSSLHVIDCIRTIVMGAAQPGSGNCEIEVELGDSNEPHPITGQNSPYECELLAYGNVSVTTTSSFGGIVYVRKFDAGSVVFEGDARLTNARTPTSHAHGNVSNSGAIGSTANLPIITTTSGVLAAGSFGTTANTFCQGNDSRLSDARTPTSHVHAAGDITSGTIATARLGSGTASASTFLRGDQAYGNASELFDFLVGSKPASATGSGGSYSWTIPATAKYITVFCHGPGAGGGSGRRGAAATARCGGGGGGCGGWGEFTYSVADLPSTTLAVTVIAGGAGGAAITTDNTDGNAGSHAAGPTKVESSGKIIAAAWGSSRGSGGGNGATAAGGDNWWSSQWSPSGGMSSGRSAAAGDASAQTSNNATRGGGGGGVDAANAHYAGGAGGGGPVAFGAASGPAGGSAGGGAGPAGTTWIKVGGGGSGGGGNNAGAGGAGGNGAFPGGGGGGGGGCVNGFASGAGGNGGDGFVRITVWY